MVVTLAPASISLLVLVRLTVRAPASELGRLGQLVGKPEALKCNTSPAENLASGRPGPQEMPRSLSSTQLLSHPAPLKLTVALVRQPISGRSGPGATATLVKACGEMVHDESQPCGVKVAS